MHGKTRPLLVAHLLALLPCAAAAQRSLLTDLAVSPDGAWLYVADAGAGELLRLPTDGGGEPEVVLRVRAEDEIAWLGRLAVADDAVFVSDPRRHRVARVDVGAGTVALLAGTGRPHPDALSHPGGLALHGGALFVADSGNRCVRRVDVASGALETVAEGRFVPSDVAFDPDGQMLVLDLTGRRVFRQAAPRGALVEVDGTRSDRAAARADFAVAGDGTLLFADAPAGWVARVAPDGRALAPLGAVDRCAAVTAHGARTWLLDAARGEVREVDERGSRVVLQRARPRPRAHLETVRREPDPAAVPAASVRAAILATGQPWHVRHAPSGVEFVLVPAGDYRQGARDAATDVRDDARPARPVRIPRPLYVARTEVTNAQLRRFAPNHVTLLSPHHRLDPDGLGAVSVDADDQPASGLCWFDADEYARAFGFRLPTEAEWEYFARAGATTRYPWGDELADGARFANLAGAALAQHVDREIVTVPYDDGFLVAAPVASFAPNAFGLFDTIGNVWEWCADWHGPGYPARDEAVVDPRGPATGTARILRGSSWQTPFAGSPLVSFRGLTRPDAHVVLSRGFRPVLDVD